MRKRCFGTLPDGRGVEALSLRRGDLDCEILTWGAALRTLRWKGLDVALGYDSLEDYLRQDKCMGATVGRFANRIGGAEFELNGKRYPLYANNGRNHLHGGREGFDRKLWTLEAAGEDFVSLGYRSPDGEEGYPGTLNVRVTYRLTEAGLRIEYAARSDADTLCNLTNHTYFNLSGQSSGPVTAQTIRLCCSRYTPTDAESIPTGEIAPVEGTPMDLRRRTPIGAHIDDDFPQLRLAGGYDHNYLVDGWDGTLRLAAEAERPETGARLEVWTDQPALQFYTGNYLDGSPPGKDGAPYANRWGFCLETQCCPDAPHHPRFPGALLRAGETYRRMTEYRLSGNKSKSTNNL